MWYELTDNKKEVNGEILTQIKYQDGHLGCFIGKDVSLPRVKCQIDKNTVIFGRCVLNGKITIKESTIGPNVKISVTRSATISGSSIKESDVNATRFKVSNSAVSFLDCRGVSFDEAGIVEITKNSSIDGTRLKTKDLMVNICSDSKSKIHITDSIIHAKKRDVFLNARRSDTLINMEKTTIVADKTDVDIFARYKSKIDIFNSIISGSVLVEEECHGNVLSSRIAGSVKGYNLDISYSKISGKVYVDGAVEIRESNLNKNTIVSCANKTPGTAFVGFFNTTMFGNSKIVSLNKDSQFKRLYVSDSVMRENSIIEATETTRFYRSSIKGSGHIIGGDIRDSVVQDDAIVSVGYATGCTFLADSRMGCTFDGTPINFSKKINLRDRTSTGKFDFISFEERDRSIMFSGDMNCVKFFDDNGVTCITCAEQKALEIVENSKFVARETVYKSIDYTLEKIKEKIINKKTNTNGISTLIGFILFSLFDKVEKNKELSKEEKTLLNNIYSAQAFNISEKKPYCHKPVFVEHKYINQILEEIASSNIEAE